MPKDDPKSITGISQPHNLDEYKYKSYEELSQEFQQAVARAFVLIPQMYNRLTLVDGLPSQERINAWVYHFGMYKFQCHCSGHARSRDLLQIVDEINARTLYPVHTEHPEIYKRTAKNVTEVIEGGSYRI